jgi:hypothetical protein
MERSQINAIPSNAEEAIEWLEYDKQILRKPAKITISKLGKYPEITGFEWQ